MPFFQDPWSPRCRAPPWVFELGKCILDVSLGMLVQQWSLTAEDCPQSLSHLSGKGSLSAANHAVARVSQFRECRSGGRVPRGVRGWCLPDKSLPSPVCSKGLPFVEPPFHVVRGAGETWAHRYQSKRMLARGCHRPLAGSEAKPSLALRCRLIGNPSSRRVSGHQLLLCQWQDLVLPFT